MPAKTNNPPRFVQIYANTMCMRIESTVHEISSVISSSCERWLLIFRKVPIKVIVASKTINKNYLKNKKRQTHLSGQVAHLHR